ncbi:MAG: SAM-dependent methyltransferase [Neisseriaceae bacterium]|jgi:hypothetical protein|nr:MAG: SAM-dependent methyltransferase [Neisseriaceae bacterium]
MAEKYDIRPGQSVELLKELHILTRDGKLNQDSRRKLKQVYHLYNFIEPLLQELKQSKSIPLDKAAEARTKGAGSTSSTTSPEDKASAGLGSGISLVDHGAGKSYLGFILYDLFFKSLADQSQIYGIETREELVQRSTALAQRLGFPGMSFLNLSVAESTQSTQLPAQIDIVTALHACNTATDDAIHFALQKQAKFMVLVPCCQAEVAAVLRQNKARMLANPMSELWRHPIHTREFGSHVTNVLRCLQLQAHGYEVNVTELVGWEHSMKNELIIARFKNLPRRKHAERLQQLLQELGLEELSGRFFSAGQNQAGAAISS